VAGRRGGNKRWEEMDKGEEGEKIGKERNEREREGGKLRTLISFQKSALMLCMLRPSTTGSPEASGRKMRTPPTLL